MAKPSAHTYAAAIDAVGNLRERVSDVMIDTGAMAGKLSHTSGVSDLRRAYAHLLEADSALLDAEIEFNTAHDGVA